MNKNRLLKLESITEKAFYKVSGVPHVWRPEKGKIAIYPSSFILDRMRELKREIVYSPYVWTAVYLDPSDTEIIDRVEGMYLYLKGLKNPIEGMQELIWKH